MFLNTFSVYLRNILYIDYVRKRNGDREDGSSISIYDFVTFLYRSIYDYMQYDSMRGTAIVDTKML